MTARIPENVPLGCSTVSIIGDTPPRDHHHGRGRRRHHRPHGGAQHRHIRARPAGRRIGGAERRRRQCRADSLPRSPRMPSRPLGRNFVSNPMTGLRPWIANPPTPTHWSRTLPIGAVSRWRDRRGGPSCILPHWVGRQTRGGGRPAIRSIAVVAAQGLAIKAVHRPSAASSRW